MSSQTLPEAFRLRAGNFNLLVLRLLDPRPDAVLPALGDQFRRAPGFLRFAPLVIGLADLERRPEDVDFRGLIAGLRALEIVPIGTTGGAGDAPGGPAGRPAAAAPGRRRQGERADVALAAGRGAAAAPAPAAAIPPRPAAAGRPGGRLQGSGRAAMLVTSRCAPASGSMPRAPTSSSPRRSIPAPR